MLNQQIIFIILLMCCITKVHREPQKSNYKEIIYLQLTFFDLTFLFYLNLQSRGKFSAWQLHIDFQCDPFFSINLTSKYNSTFIISVRSSVIRPQTTLKENYKKWNMFFPAFLCLKGESKSTSPILFFSKRLVADIICG